MSMNSSGWQLQHSYQELAPILFKHALPKQFDAPKSLLLNEPLARQLGIDCNWLKSEQATEALSGNHLLENSRPIAQAYAGHQFGHFTVLGDGRAILLGEHQMANGQLVDLQLKGSGPTPYSRRGDGLATLASMLKEYVFSEAMHALGIPTTRSLAIIQTGEFVRRQQIQPGAVLTRIANSHIRIGTFEFASLDSIETLKSLADYTIKRHDPDLIDQDDRYLAFLERVMDRQAALIAQWMSVGFVHGVMNTDNASIAGETIDYGPCAFIDEYDPEAVFSSIDLHGRYAYASQATIMHWNLCRFAETLLPLIKADDAPKAVELAQEVLQEFPKRFKSQWEMRFCQKIGFNQVTPIGVSLLNELLEIMHEEKADFTSTFRDLSLNQLTHPALMTWQANWKNALESNQDKNQAIALMRAVNPRVIPRNHVVKEVIDAAEASGNLTTFNELVEILRNPFADNYANHRLAFARPAGMLPTVTYCGT